MMIRIEHMIKKDILTNTSFLCTFLEKDCFERKDGIWRGGENRSRDSYLSIFV